MEKEPRKSNEVDKVMAIIAVLALLVFLGALWRIMS